MRFTAYNYPFWDIAVEKTMNFFVIGVGNVMVLSTNGNLFISGTLAQSSDRNLKEGIQAASPKEVLAKVAAMPISEWSYKTDSGTRHMGQMSQDFHAAFNLNGEDDKHITTVDEGGVALVAIQGLNQKLEEKNAKLEAQAAQIDALNARLEKLEHLLSQPGASAQ